MKIGAANGNLVYEARPDWMRTWENTGLVSFEDRNGDGRIQYYNDANPSFAPTADSFGWQGNELSVDNDIMVLANPEIAGLPNWVIALVAAGGIAAALSTAAGLLLVISAAVSHDLIKGIFMPSISEKRELLAGRIAAAVRDHDCRLSRFRSPRLGGAGRRVRFRPGRGIVVPRDPARNFLQTSEPRRARSPACSPDSYSPTDISSTSRVCS